MAAAPSWKPEPAPQPAFYRRRKKRSPNLLGQILLRRGDISPQILRKALRVQEERGGQLGRILLGAGACARAPGRRSLGRSSAAAQARRRQRLARSAREPGVAGCRWRRPVAHPVARAHGPAGVPRRRPLGHGVEVARTGALSATTLPLLGLAAALCLAAFWVLGLYGAMAPSPPDEIRNATAATTLAPVLRRGRHPPPRRAARVVAAAGGRDVGERPAARPPGPLGPALRVRPSRVVGAPRHRAGRRKDGPPRRAHAEGAAAQRHQAHLLLDDDPAKQGTLRASFTNEMVDLRSMSISARIRSWRRQRCEP